MTPSAAPIIRPMPVVFDEVEHVYMSPKGVPYPGVTTVLKSLGKPWMGPWMLKEAEKHLMAEWKANTPYSAADRNTIIGDAKRAYRPSPMRPRKREPTATP